MANQETQETVDYSRYGQVFGNWEIGEEIEEEQEIRYPLYLEGIHVGYVRTVAGYIDPSGFATAFTSKAAEAVFDASNGWLLEKVVKEVVEEVYGKNRPEKLDDATVKKAGERFYEVAGHIFAPIFNPDINLKRRSNDGLQFKKAE